MLWEIDVYPSKRQPDVAGQAVAAAAARLGIAERLIVKAGRGFLLQGRLDRAHVERIARELLIDSVIEEAVVGAIGEVSLAHLPPNGEAAAADPATSAPWRQLSVLPRPGVMDPVAQSTQAAIASLGYSIEAVRTFKRYWIRDLPEAQLPLLQSKVLAREVIEQVVLGPLALDRLELDATYQFELKRVPLEKLDDEALLRHSRDGQLFLSLDEMRAIQSHFRRIDREPTDAELETIAQTWSEHCSHKTLAGPIEYRDDAGSRRFENMLRETIFAATDEIRSALGADDWCVSVFSDNAGIVRFDEQFNVAFKVETHNHPSAIEPYGGANTGVGGVIRDILGTGLGAKPVCTTDVLCFAAPDTSADELPPGVLHPRHVMNQVVAGVRDYGNRMGIPTVNGAIYFDPRYLANPLVYCGCVGLLPRDKSFKCPRPGDHIVVLGGRTGRDGLHGATFSSSGLTSRSETISSGAVQLGNAITQKTMLDVILQARDRELYSAVTDCGAGGLSSAVSEMGQAIGAEVWLDRVPLKYAGLSYTEIWISEAQERMILSVPPQHWEQLAALCRAEGVEAAIIGRFVPTGALRLKFGRHIVADLTMEFLFDRRPRVVRQAVYSPPPVEPLSWHDEPLMDHGDTLHRILGSLNVASKQWVVRQYDHEVQGGSVVKPLVGAHDDGPSDAAIVRPVLGSRRGIVVACGMNPRLADFDTYDMAASAIDEALRNCIAVGADPGRIAILDNFCWGDTEQPGTLGSLVRAAVACHDVAVALGTPFISGKDSLNNCFRYVDQDGCARTISIPPSLLISALGQIDDVARAVTMDLKQPGNVLFLVGLTRDELGGSHFALVHGLSGGTAPRLDCKLARRTFAAVHAAIHDGLVRACHDLSEGGLAVAAAEMALAGDWGAAIYLDDVPSVVESNTGANTTHSEATLLFAESNSRFLCEVPPEHADEFSRRLADVPHARIGQVTDRPRMEVFGLGARRGDDRGGRRVIDADLTTLKAAWKAPLSS